MRATSGLVCAAAIVLALWLIGPKSLVAEQADAQARLEALPGWPSVTEGQLRAHLTQMKAMRITGLKLLSCHGCLDAVRQLTELTQLDLSGTRMSDLNGLKGLTKLKRLNVSGTSVTSLDGIQGLSTLTQLDVSGTEVSELEPLKGLTALRVLDLDGTSVSSVSELKGLVNLRALDLSGTDVTDVSTLRGLGKLTALDLAWTSVTDIGGLEKLAMLVELNLIGTQVKDVSALKGHVAHIWRDPPVETPVPSTASSEPKKDRPVGVFFKLEASGAKAEVFVNGVLVADAEGAGQQIAMGPLVAQELILKRENKVEVVCRNDSDTRRDPPTEHCEITLYFVSDDDPQREGPETIFTTKVRLNEEPQAQADGTFVLSSYGEKSFVERNAKQIVRGDAYERSAMRFFVRAQKALGSKDAETLRTFFGNAIDQTQSPFVPQEEWKMLPARPKDVKIVLEPNRRLFRFGLKQAPTYSAFVFGNKQRGEYQYLPFRFYRSKKDKEFKVLQATVNVD